MRNYLVTALIIFLIVITPLLLSAGNDGRNKRSPRVMLVIDVSASMSWDNKISDAVNWAIENVVDVGSDDLEIGVITFASCHERLMCRYNEGGKAVVSPWFKLPAASPLEQLKSRLRGLTTSGTTMPDQAVKDAMLSGSEAILVITDADFDMNSDLAHVINNTYKKLIDNNLRIPMISFLVMYPTPRAEERITEIAKITKCRLWIKDKPEIDQDKKD